MILLKKHITLLLIGILISLSSQSQSEEKILWDDDLAFSWELFKEKKSSYNYIKAMTYSGIMYEVEVEDDMVKIDVSAYFIYGKSWVMKGFKKPHLLSHEKIHFDIAELYKRKLNNLCNKYRVDYNSFVNRNYDKSLQRDFNRIFDEMDAFQEKYDSETNHGTITSKQKEWEQKIKTRLANS